VGGWSGRCLCGAVRYELRSEPFDCGWCHCRTCQLSSGAPAVVFATVPAGDLAFVEGADKVRRFDSSRFGRRTFCGECGTLLLMQVDHQPDTVDLTVATLDDPDMVPPGFHIFHASRIGWFETADALPRHARFRPDTRGLEGTEPPGSAAFEAATGCPVLVNTSFNVRGEPIVCTPADAYRCFMRTNLDYLVLGPFLLDKTAQAAPLEGVAAAGREGVSSW